MSGSVNRDDGNFAKYRCHEKNRDRLRFIDNKTVYKSFLREVLDSFSATRSLSHFKMAARMYVHSATSQIFSRLQIVTFESHLDTDASC